MGATHQAGVRVLQHEEVAVVEVGADCPRGSCAIDQVKGRSHRTAYLGPEQRTPLRRRQDHLTEGEICGLLFEE